MPSCKFFVLISQLCLIIFLYWMDIGTCLLELKAGLSRSVFVNCRILCLYNIVLYAEIVCMSVNNCLSRGQVMGINGI